MRLLPPLVVDRGRWELPISDRSAVLLEELLLVGSPGAGLIDLLAQQLARDPALLLWYVCAGMRGAAQRPASLVDVAQHLGANALGALRWQTGQDRCDQPVEDSRAETLGYLLAAAVELAELASRLARSAVERPADPIYLAGLLYYAPQWLAATSIEPTTPADQAFPAWLPELAQGTPAGAVREAVAALAGQRPASEALAAHMEQSRRRASEVRAEWLAPCPGLGSLLPLLASRLARLQTLEQDFHAAVEREKLAALYEFAAGAGHEINNPLTVISGRAQLFLRDEHDPERRRGLALIHAQAMRVHEMIADMSHFARPPAPQRRSCDLTGVVDQVLAQLTSRAEEQQTELIRAGAAEPLTIEADPVQLAVAVRAVCVNALEALGSGGRVEVRTERSGADCTIIVSDNGPGILPEVRAHLFDPFYCARQAGRGLGMGLSKCWRIVAQHGGRVDVASEPGRGATFIIRLPGP